MQFKNSSRSILTVVIRAGLASALLATSNSVQAADARSQPAKPAAAQPAVTVTTDTPDGPPLKELTGWTGSGSLINFGGGGLGSSWVNVQVTINPLTQTFGQYYRSVSCNVGTGTVSVTISPSTPTIAPGTTFDIIVVNGRVNFNVISAIPGFTYENNVLRPDGFYAFRLTKL